ncbi:hypothetical protein M770_29835 [Pseudomonas aeruginosa VRFPA03]|nr:hypothetical protein M770_29835 [Pseudomonas aeruginosa VRFPA03]
MSGTFKGLTQAQIDRRLKEGRGQGQGRDYKPFIYTRAGRQLEVACSHFDSRHT